MKLIALSALFFSIVTLGLCGVMGFVPMNGHKFPPDFLLVSYGITMLSVISLIFIRVDMKKNRMIELWQKRGYTIYLYQNIVYFCFVEICKYIGVSLPGNLLGFFMSVISVFLLSTLCSYVFYPLETEIIRFIKR